jgi:hypothetical protein
MTDKKCIQNLVVNLEGKRLLGRPRRRWEDNMEMYLMKVGLLGVDWIFLAQVRDPWRDAVNAVMKL